jgi:hypothetical protein
MLLLIYTSCRPAELVDAAKGNATSRQQAYKDKYKDDSWDSRYKSFDKVKDKDPVYKNLEP